MTAPYLNKIPANPDHTKPRAPLFLNNQLIQVPWTEQQKGSGTERKCVKVFYEVSRAAEEKCSYRNVYKNLIGKKDELIYQTNFHMCFVDFW